MNRQQEHLLQLLVEIDAICEKHGITYFIGMGTLIGAVRNGGFLPWDDDADVLMPYADYLRFIEACKTDLPANRYLGTPTGEDLYCSMLPRYVSRETTVIHCSQSLYDDVAGDVIDIFVLDPIGDDDAGYEAYLQDLYLYSSIVNPANSNATRVELPAERYRRYLGLMAERGRREVVRLLDAKLVSHHSEAGSRCVFRWIGFPALFERAWFAESVPVEFEGVTLRAPGDVNALLTAFYGEEWFEVPAEINPSKHDIADSTLFPYTEALELFHPKYDREQLRAECAERVGLRLDTAEHTLRTADERVSIEARLQADELAALIADNAAAFERALAEKDGATLAVLLDGYLSWQTLRATIGNLTNGGMYRYHHAVLAPVDARTFEAALYALVATARIRHASRLLDLWRRDGRETTPQIEQVAAAIGSYRAAMDDYQSGRHEAGLEKARELVAAFPLMNPFRKMECIHLAALGRPDELGAAVAAGRAEFPADGFYLKHEADMADAHGEHERAREMYLCAAECTLDGFVLTDIARRTGYHPAWMRETDWGREAHVPAWDGPVPEPLAAAPRPLPELRDPVKDQLIALLGEAAGLLEAAGVAYTLAPETAALLSEGELPDRIDAYALVCKPHDALRVIAALEAAQGGSREVEHLGNSTSLKERTVRWRGTDSLYMTLKRGHTNPFKGLYVSVLFPEPESYPAALERTLAELHARRTRDFAPKGRRASMYARLHRLGSVRTEAGAKLFRLAMRNSRRSGAFLRQADRDPQPFDPRVLDALESIEFEGRSFKVPRDLDAYTAPFAGVAPSPFLRCPTHYICSARTNFEGLLASSTIDPGYFARVRETTRINARAKEIYERFRYNFRQMKQAVREKERRVLEQGA